MEIKLCHGRPDDISARLPKEVRCYDLLDSLGIEYDRIDHPAAETMDDCAETDAVLGCEMCKNLFLCNRQKTEYYLLIMKGSKPFKTKDVSHELGVARLSFADAADMEKYLDITPGSVSVLGLANDRDCRVRLLVDSDLLSDEYIGAHPCINTSSLRIRREDIFGKFLTATRHGYTAVNIKQNPDE